MWVVVFPVYTKWQDAPWNVSWLCDLRSGMFLECQRFCTCSARDPWCCSLRWLHTHTHTHSVYTSDFLTFPPGSRGVWGKFNDAAKSILFQIPRDVGKAWREVRSRQAGVCKWETGDRSAGDGSILLLSRGLVPLQAFLPILSPAFILITTCIISCQLLTPVNRKGCPQRPCFFCILFSI